MPPPYPKSIVGKALRMLRPSGDRMTPGVNRGELFFGPAQTEQEFAYGPVEQIERRGKRKRLHRRHSSGAGPDQQEPKIPAQSKTSAQGSDLPTFLIDRRLPPIRWTGRSITATFVGRNYPGPKPTGCKYHRQEMCEVMEWITKAQNIGAKGVSPPEREEI